MTACPPARPSADKAALVRVGEAVRRRLAADPNVYKVPVEQAEIFAVSDFLSIAECAHLITLIDEVAKPSDLFSDSTSFTPDSIPESCLSGGAFSGITVNNIHLLDGSATLDAGFTPDQDPPHVTGHSYEEVNEGSDDFANLSLTFNASINPGSTFQGIKVYNKDGQAETSSAFISRNTLTLQFPVQAAAKQSFRVVLPTNSLTDAIGNGIQIQDTVGDVTVKGGQISNLTNNDLPADGGLASARSAPGADYDTAFVS